MGKIKDWMPALLMWAGTCLLGAADSAPAPADLPKKVGSTIGANAPMEYVLSPRDVVLIRVLDENELETRAIISQDGRIQVPLAGMMSIGGKRVDEAITLIREALAKDYLVNPQVMLSVVESDKQVAAQQGFTVLGQVNRPSIYPLPLDKPINLLNAIAMAGGYTRMAAPWKITVTRKVEGQLKTFKLDAEAMGKDAKVPPFMIQADDTIIVEERLL